MFNINTLLFAVYPYVAFAVCIVGCALRYDLAQYTWRANSSQVYCRNESERRQFRIASNLFHVGVLFIICGHVVGLLTPHFIYEPFISTGNKQLLAMVSGGFFGVLALIGLWMLLKRRLNDERVRVNSSRADIGLLYVLLLQLALGLMTIVASTHHLDGSVMLKLAGWAQSIVTLQPLEAARNIEDVSLVYKLHIVVGLSLFVLCPFTRLVHIISAPVWYLGRSYQIVRKKA